jgi:hypothetical protein
VNENAHRAVYEIDLFVAFGPRAAVGAPLVAGLIFFFLRFGSLKVVRKDQFTAVVSVEQAEREERSEEKKNDFHVGSVL